MASDLQVVLDIVVAAGTKAMRWKAELGHENPEIKHDGSPVTVVDKKLNELLISELTKAFKNDKFIGEESAVIDQQPCDRIWYIDPLDGTKEFVKGRPDWSILVGLCVDERPELAVVGHAETGIYYFAQKGQGSFKLDVNSGKKEKIYVDTTESLLEACVVGSQSSVDPYEQKLMSTFNIVNKIKKGSIGLKAATIACGDAHLYVNSHKWCSYWDMVASELILTEAGGLLLDFNLKPLRYDAENGVDVDFGFFMISKSLFENNKEKFAEVFSED